MPKLLLAAVPPKETIKQTLEQRLPQYTYTFRGNLIVVQKTGFVGAMVVPKKDGVIINGNFPTMGATFLYVLLLVGTGIIVGLLIWALVWRSGQNAVRDEVQSVLAQSFGVALAA